MTQLLPQRPAVLGEQVANSLRRLIVTGALPPGSSLVEGKLADQFQVSRGPIRDALRILSKEGLIATTGRSAKVLGLTARDVDELFSLREAMEHLALESALAGDAEGLSAALDAALKSMAHAVERRDAQGFTEADSRFHSAFYQKARHRRLADVWSQYQPTIDVLLMISNDQQPDLAPAYRAHELLASLIAKRDAQAAFDELHAHLNNSRLRLRAPYEA
jgi:DNA-binding GntR family transcriptional regulator